MCNKKSNTIIYKDPKKKKKLWLFDSKLKVLQIYSVYKTKQKILLNFWTFDFVRVGVKWRSEWCFELLILHLTKVKSF